MNAVVPERRPQPGVGLAMSGGGYRASLFHLGSLRRLAEMGVLERVVHVDARRPSGDDFDVESCLGLLTR